MRSLRSGKCLRCNAVYEAPLLKFRVQLGPRTYERCNCCGRWAWHKLFVLQIKKSEAKE